MDIWIWTQLDPERTINWVQKDIQGLKQLSCRVFFIFLFGLGYKVLSAYKIFFSNAQSHDSLSRIHIEIL